MFCVSKKKTNNKKRYQLLGGWRLPGTDNQPEGAVSHTLVRLSVRRIRLLNAVVSMSTVQGRKGSNSGLPAPAPAPPPSYLQVPLDGKPSPGSSRQFGPPVPSAMSPAAAGGSDEMLSASAQGIFIGAAGERLLRGGGGSNGDLASGQRSGSPGSPRSSGAHSDSTSQL